MQRRDVNRFLLSSFAMISDELVDTAMAAERSTKIKKISVIHNLRDIKPDENYEVEVSGYWLHGDGGGGRFRGLTGARKGEFVDDGGIIIVPNGGDGTSAWVRTYQDITSVSWFGAHGDGKADDSSAFQAALNYGGLVVVPRGRYNISKEIKISNSSLMGAPGSIIVLCENNAKLIIDQDFSSINNLIVEAGAIMQGPCVDVISYKAFWQINNVICWSNKGKIYNGIQVSNGLSGTISNCRIDSAANIGIYVTNEKRGYANAISVMSCRVRGSAVADFLYENGVNGSLISCVAEGAADGSDRYVIRNSASVNITGCYAENSRGSHGVSYKIESSYNCVINSNSNYAKTAFLLSGKSSDNYINGTGPEDCDVIYGISEGCRDNTIFWGGYVRTNRIKDNGIRTTIFVNGGFSSGDVSRPGLRLNSFGSGYNSGIYGGGNKIGMSIDGVSVFQVNHPGNNETSMFLQVDRDGKLDLSRVSIGEPDSAGHGYRTIRVKN